jgi:hypothetical protein
MDNEHQKVVQTSVDNDLAALRLPSFAAVVVQLKKQDHFREYLYALPVRYQRCTRKSCDSQQPFLLKRMLPSGGGNPDDLHTCGNYTLIAN